MFKELFALISAIFIIWELHLIFNKQLLTFHVNNIKKNQYKRTQRVLLTFYTVYIIIALIFPGRWHFISILALKLVVDLLLNLNMPKNAKFWILRVDSLISASLMIHYTYYVLWLI